MYPFQKELPRSVQPSLRKFITYYGSIIELWTFGHSKYALSTVIAVRDEGDALDVLHWDVADAWTYGIWYGNINLATKTTIEKFDFADKSLIVKCVPNMGTVVLSGKLLLGIYCCKQLRCLPLWFRGVRSIQSTGLLAVHPWIRCLVNNAWVCLAVHSFNLAFYLASGNLTIWPFDHLKISDVWWSRL